MPHNPEEFVKIARDILDRLKYLKLAHGTYLDGSIAFDEIPSEGDAKKYLPKIEKACEVCAKGALFLSHIRVNDKVDLSELVREYRFESGNKYIGTNSTRICDTRTDYISQDQLDLVEAAFEMWGEYDGGDSKTARFGERYKTHRGRPKA